MAKPTEIVAAALAASLGVVLLGALSEGAARLLLRIWALTAPLCLMAFLETGRRGITRRGGRLSWREFAQLALKAAAVGLLLACAAVGVAAFSAFETSQAAP